MTSNERNNNKSSSMVRRVSSDENNNENQPSSRQQQTQQQQQQQLPESFPIKLHRILEDAEINSFEDVISWIPSNNGFKVHDPKSFEDDIMPKYFNNTKYKSFQRQLNMWNFERQNSSGPNLNLTLMKKSSSIPSGIDAACPPKGSYLHLCFIRGKPELCSKMERIKIKGILSKKKKRKSSSIANNNSTPAATVAAAAVTNNESLILAQSRVAQLQRKKEEIERNLSSITQQMENFPPPNHRNNSATTTTNSSHHYLPRASYNPNMDIDNSGMLNNDCSSKRRGSIGSIGSIGTIGSGNGLIRCSSIDTIQSLLGEGDSLCFEGKTFHFAADHHHHHHHQGGATPNNNNNNNNNNSNDRWNVAPADNQPQQQQRRRSVGRRYSLELVDSESDEYVLKELEEAIELGTGMFGAANATTAAAAPATTTGDNNSGDGGTTRSSSSNQNQNIPFVDTRSSTYNKPLLSHRVSLQDQSNNDSSNDNSNNSITTIPFSIPTKLNNYVQGATSSSNSSSNRRSSNNNSKKNKKVGENFLSNNMPLFHLNLDRPRRRFSLTSTSVHDPFENNNLRELYNKLEDEQYNLMKATTEQQQQQAQYNLMKATTRMTSTAEKIANNFFPSSSSNVNVIDNGNIKMSPRVSF